MRYTAERYRRLACKYGLDEWEVASAACEVMLAASTRNGGNPWAVVTRAMKSTCGVEVRAAGMLVSPGQVRHTARSVGFHDAIRFAERENPADYDPAFVVNPTTTDDEEDFDGSDRARVAAVLSEIVGLFASAGWDAVLVADCIVHVVYRGSDLPAEGCRGATPRPRDVDTARDTAEVVGRVAADRAGAPRTEALRDPDRRRGARFRS